MDEEARKHPRFEPSFTDAIIAYDGREIRGRVLDSSRSGMAVALAENINLPANGISVNVAVASHTDKVNVGVATVCRCWPDSNILKRADQLGLLDNGKGIALAFQEELHSKPAEPYLLSGNQQKTRLKAQSELAAIDINYLSGYRRDLVSNQINLFVLSLTVGVSLAGIYSGLSYHSVATARLANPTLSFWRMVVAALPGGLATACALMVAHKGNCIQRIDSYILILKKCSILKQFPREYKGWESAYRKLRHVLNSKLCAECDTGRKCGSFKSDEVELLDSRKLFTSPRVGSFHLIVYLTFFVIMTLSLIAVLMELMKYQFGIESYMAIASGITLIIFFIFFLFVFIFYHLRKGRLSVDYYKRCWIDLINNCRRQV